MIRDPKLINTILIKDFWHFTDRGIEYRYLPEGKRNDKKFVYFKQPKVGKYETKIINPDFTSSKLKYTHKYIIRMLWLSN